MTAWKNGAAKVGHWTERLCSERQVEWSGEVQQLSWAPRLFLYKGFLLDEECDHLIEMVTRPMRIPISLPKHRPPTFA